MMKMKKILLNAAFILAVTSILIQMLPWIMRIIYQKKVRCTPVTLVS